MSSSTPPQHSRILILDFGAQYTQLIARRVRELHVYCEIHRCDLSLAVEADSPDCDPGVFELGVPVLGICYGLQLLVKKLGGRVEASSDREYGRARLKIEREDRLLAGIPLDSENVVWMSHGDRVLELPVGFETVASTGSSPFAVVGNPEARIWGVQFHPEVVHTEDGQAILRNFVLGIAGCEADWTTSAVIDESIAKIRQQVGDGRAICGLSGGVDSSVAAALVHRAIGDQLTCIFVDHGLMRENERAEVEETFSESLGIRLISVDASQRFLSALAGVSDPEKKRRIIGGVDASQRFLSALAGVSDPEKKRRIIGGLFIEVFEEEAAKVGDAQFLVQGTLYPDVIESVSVKGASHTIKTHHNVGGLPEDMKLALVEPLRELFKDEVREVGRGLGLPERAVGRHPFPGPGLAIRIMGEVTRDRLEPLRRADAIMNEEIRKAGLYDEIWQALVVFLPVQSVGVMGDARTYENAVAVRCVTSSDAMTADFAQLPWEVLARISNRIINEVQGINRVVYDVSSKPPATIEWE